MPRASDAPKPYLTAKRWEFPKCTYSMGEKELVTISERQAELQLYITINGRSGTEDRNKCQTQTKVNHPALKAKTSATEWILWKNA